MAKAISVLYQQHPAQCLECNIKCGTWTEWAAETFCLPFLYCPLRSFHGLSTLSSQDFSCLLLPASLSFSLHLELLTASCLYFLPMENSLSRRPMIRKHAWFSQESSESVQSTRDVIKLVPAFEVPALHKTTIPQLSSNVLLISWLHLMSQRRLIF